MLSLYNILNLKVLLYFTNLLLIKILLQFGEPTRKQLSDNNIVH